MELKLLGFINACDYIVSVDTAQFHAAGGLKKPLVGIYTFADGDVYGRYYQFELVQKHRKNGDWDCGPCYAWANCSVTKDMPKPCLEELSVDLIMDGVDRMFEKWSWKSLNHR